MRRVVITGIGIISPIGIGSRAHWDGLVGGKMGINRIAAFDPSNFPCQLAGEVQGYKIGEFVPKAYRKATKVMARDIELAVVAADDAFKDAGLQSHAYTETPNFDGRRFGCNIGAGLINPELNELTAALTTARSSEDPNQVDLKKWGRDGMAQLTPLWLLKYLPNMLACHVTIIHQLKGPSNTITCADASSHLAIGEAFRTIQRGKADLAICGGAESKTNPMGILRQTLIKRLNESSNAAPAEAVRPFDADAGGTVLGEGGGLLILEEYESAKKRGVKIYAELVGFAASQDSYRITDPEPSGHSYSKAIANALKDAKLSADEIDLVVPNGLGIATHDRAELAGLRTALGKNLERIPFAPMKAQIGSLAAGTGVDAASAVLALHHGTIPPAVNTKKPLDGVKLNVSPEARNAKINIAVCSTYSLGGQNAALVFRRIDPVSER
ncbi:MAG: beta-ketoacyl-[acyl-carrier-protein] synthase family protein [Planctomycetota bacterium]|nr:beta-ketoacyl-[acyl-carrier-protein] synthase family protein [Planctomycetota bacterium]